LSLIARHYRAVHESAGRSSGLDGSERKGPRAIPGSRPKSSSYCRLKMPSAQELQYSSPVWWGDLCSVLAALARCRDLDCCWHEGASGLPAGRYAPQGWQSVGRGRQHGVCRILSITSLRSSGVLQIISPSGETVFCSSAQPKRGMTLKRGWAAPSGVRCADALCEFSAAEPDSCRSNSQS
jgi:hypothetical protein